ncbi:hypothetical protein CH339_23060 [Rhodobium orientis]|uniref:Uncharacterized protein n=1 Tax=Rhodobium orientis TaxID=34017 RepID=A0A327JGE9_9HYPH|nr:hypothetical protein [Rhodobium orientis]RAI23853.1 hypothetical protein CH339_23060 [Rhodobium orientis]
MFVVSLGGLIDSYVERFSENHGRSDTRRTQPKLRNRKRAVFSTVLVSLGQAFVNHVAKHVRATAKPLFVILPVSDEIQ